MITADQLVDRFDLVVIFYSELLWDKTRHNSEFYSDKIHVDVGTEVQYNYSNFYCRVAQLNMESKFPGAPGNFVSDWP